jgi:hypothetical protein
MNTIKTISLIFLITFGLSTIAQEHKEVNKKERSKLIEEMKRSYINDQLDLNEGKAKAFIALMDEYNEKKKEIKKESHLKGKDQKKETKLNEIEANLMLSRKIETKEKLLNLEREYIANSIKQISAIKVLEYYTAEREFKRKLLKMLEEKKCNGSNN